MDSHRDACTDCGSCLEVCQVYDDAGMLNKLYEYIEGGELPVELDLTLCFVCGRCADACSQNFGIIQLMRAARERWFSENGPSPSACHSNPDFTDNIFSTFEKEVPSPEFKDGMAPIAYRPGCYAVNVHPYISIAATRILDLAGVDYWVQVDREGVSRCCGMITAGLGDPSVMTSKAESNVQELKDKGTELLVCSCPVCAKAFKFAYKNILRDHGIEVIHTSQLLLSLIQDGKLKFKGFDGIRVYYHDPCHLSLGLGVRDEPRKVLQSIPGVELLNPTMEGSTCCAFSGGVRMNHPSLSLDIAREEIERLECDHVDVIITNCAGCEQNLIEASIDKDVDVMDLGEFILLALGEDISRDDDAMVKRLNRAYSKAIDGYETPSLYATFK